MSDQISELRDYCERLDEFQGEIDVAALIEADAPPVILADERARRRRPWAVLAAAGVAVALGLAGLIAWSAGDEPVSTDVGTVDRPTTTGPDEPPTDATAYGSSGVVLGGNRNSMFHSSRTSRCRGTVAPWRWRPGWSSGLGPKDSSIVGP